MGTRTDYDFEKIEQEHKTYRVLWASIALVCVSGIAGLTLCHMPPTEKKEAVESVSKYAAESDKQIQDAKNILYSIQDRNDSEEGAALIAQCAETLRKAYEYKRTLTKPVPKETIITCDGHTNSATGRFISVWDVQHNIIQGCSCVCHKKKAPESVDTIAEKK